MNIGKVKMVECTICLEEYQEGHLEHHNQTCVLRLVFRCSICNEEYVSREGLWNHLDLHEISDDDKELHCQELQAKHKLLQCALCNDQRGYSESSYGMHVLNFHGNCKDHDKVVASEFSVMADEPVSVKVEHTTSDGSRLKQSWKEQNDNGKQGHDSGSIEQSRVNLNADAGNGYGNKESELSSTLQPRLACDECEKTFSFKSALLRHKKTSHNELKYPCLACEKVFRSKADSVAHEPKCKQMMWMCNLCGLTFSRLKSITRHSEINHPENGSSETIQLVQKQVQNSNLQRQHSAKETTEPSTNDQTEVTVDVLDSQSSEGDAANRNDNAFGHSSTDKQVVLSKIQLPFACPICDITLYSHHQIAFHRRTEHTEASLQCSNCSRKFHIRKRFESHVADCATTKLICDICGHKFSHLRTLQRHKRNIHRINKVSEDQFSTETIAVTQKLSHGSTSTHVNSEAATGLGDGIKIKEELSEIEKETGTDQSFAKTSESQFKQGSKCSICGHSFSNTNRLWYHKVVDHSDPKYKCPFCQNMFYFSSHLSNHQKGCSKLRCHKCNIKFRNRGQLERHNTEKHSHDSKPEHSTAENAIGLESRMEVKKELLDNEEESSTKHLETAESLEGNKAKGITCLICGLSFKNDRILWYHKTVTHRAPRYECSLCRKEFYFAVHLRDHQKGCRELRCHKCDIRFRNRGQLNRHNIYKHPHDSDSKGNEGLPEPEIGAEIVNEHQARAESPGVPIKRRGPVRNDAGDLVWPCPICKLTFETKSRKKYHMIMLHTQPRHECCYCKKMFHLSTNLRSHVKSCSVLRCHECGIIFTSRGLLNKHNINKHSNNMEGKEAKVEDKTVTPESVEQRNKSHVPHNAYSCSKCGRTYASKYYMQYHELTGHTEPEHKCSFCHKMFHVARILRKHMKFCSERRCHKCGVIFTSRVRLNNHMISKHSHDDEPMKTEDADLVDATEM